ncbi:plasmid mobilization protein [Arthrobacter antibioticus]|uniref:plasmid mobilization protein n=1 Tax=Arthrobacter sp. H35-MC1 TaxID=3046203 RepID=UPI0024BA871D|nr:plasmid mobilization relaxosome protein MobC [Arthrobacter sp. H35-MC1]MDJ0318591.1 plasmid mobilization relaxosome protein MobC [Arthrobacter sp. H35-MC1]
MSEVDVADVSWGKTNRDDVQGGRKKQHTYRVSVAEEAALKVRAQQYGISVARLVVESALSREGESHSDRQALIQELAQVRTLLSRVSSNINQIARHANATGDFPADAAASVAAMRQLMLRIDDTVRGVAGR